MANISHPPEHRPHSFPAIPRSPTKSTSVSGQDVKTGGRSGSRVPVHQEPRDCKESATFAIFQECACVRLFRVQILELSGSPQWQACGYV